jgi:hypothetical protein
MIRKIIQFQWLRGRQKVENRSKSPRFGPILACFSTKNRHFSVVYSRWQ